MSDNKKNKTGAGALDPKPGPAALDPKSPDNEQAPAPVAEAESSPTPPKSPDSEPTPAPAAEAESSQAAPGLKPLSEWFKEKRLASWQSAGLLRAQGWTADKMVSAAEFDSAFNQLMHRPQGARV